MAPAVVNYIATADIKQEKALNRTERLVISGPIIIATAIGVDSIATAAATAHIVATQETNRVIKEEQAHRIEDVTNDIHNNQVNLNISGQIAKDIDNIRYTSALSTHAINNLNHASDINNKFNHGVPIRIRGMVQCN